MNKRDILMFGTVLHEEVPPGWYYTSIRENPLQAFWHKQRFAQVEKIIQPVDGKVLDIGSADGVFTKLILDRSGAMEVQGIDVNKTSVEWARNHWQNKKMFFSFGDAHSLKYASGTFSAVFALEVLEHVLEPKRVLGEIKRVLKPGGYAVFLVPTDSMLFKLIWYFWTRFRGRIWKDTHIQTYKNNHLTKIAKEAGFRIEIDKKFLFGMLHLVRVRKT